MKQLPTGFKDGFLWGGAVAACQIEGAYDVDGRGLSSSDIHAYDKNLFHNALDNRIPYLRFFYKSLLKYLHLLFQY